MKNGTMTIHAACRAGQLDRVSALVAEEPTLVDADDQHCWRPIFHAALGRHLEVVRFLIAAGADLAAHDGYALHYAAEVPDNLEIVALLVQHGALEAHVRPPNDLCRQFLAAVFLADDARVHGLLRFHPQLATTVDGRGDYPIHHAARNGNTKIVKRLLAFGADVNAKSEQGHTVLYCAGGHGHVETVQLLIENGADIQAKFTKDGKTLLEWLAQFPDDQRFTHVAEVLRLGN